MTDMKTKIFVKIYMYMQNYVHFESDRIVFSVKKLWEMITLLYTKKKIFLTRCIISKK